MKYYLKNQKKKEKGNINLKGNKENYIFKVPNIYTLKANLFTYKLLPININTYKMVEFTCIILNCNYKYEYKAIKP